MTLLARGGLLLLVGLPLLALVLQGLDVHPDTARDWLLAAECLRPEGCLLRGPPASLEPLYQGGLWIAHLAALQRLGLGLAAAQVLAALLYAAAALCMGMLGERIVDRLTGLCAAALLALWPMALTTEIATQWNPSLIALPAAVLTIAALHAVVSGKLAPWLLAALALATLVQLHLVSLVLLPCVAALFVFFPPIKPLRAALLSLALLATSILLVSRDALPPIWSALTEGTTSAQQATQHGLSPLPFALGSLAIFAVFQISPWTRPAARTPQAWALMALSLLPMLLLATALLIAGQEVKFYYFAPFRMGLALLLAWWLVAALRWLLARELSETTQTLAGLALLACTVPLLWPHPRPPGVLTFADVDRIQDKLADAGVCSIQDWWRLQGPELGAFFVGQQAQPRRKQACHLQPGTWLLWRDEQRPGQPLPPGAREVALDAGDRLLLAPGSTALDWSHATVQAQLADDLGKEEHPLLLGGGLSSQPGYPHLQVSRFDRAWRDVTVRWPLHLKADQELVLLPCATQPEPGVVLGDVRTLGLPSQRQTDGSLRITARPTPQDGWLDIAWHNQRPEPPQWLPGVLQLPANGAAASISKAARKACR